MAKRKRPSPKNVLWKNIYPKSRMITENPEFKAMSFGAQVLYDVLCRLRYALRDTDNDNSFWRTDLMLMRDAGMSRNSMKRFRHELVDKKFILWHSHTHEKHKPPRYFIMDDVHTQADDTDAVKGTWKGFWDDPII